MRIMPFRRNGGSGTARRIGTLEARGEIVVWTDADMTYPERAHPRVRPDAVDDPTYDQVVGARTSEEGTHKILRVPAKWVIRKIAEKLVELRRSPTSTPGCARSAARCRCPTCGCCRRGSPASRRSRWRSCPTSTTSATSTIDYAKRSGTSKFHFTKDAYRYILQVLRMVMYFNPLKVLMPLALWLLAIGLAKGVYDLFAHFGRFAVNTVLIFITGMLIAALALLADLIVRSRSDT